MLTEARINEFYTSFISKLEEVGVDPTKMVEFLGEEKIKQAPGGLETKSGLAFPGALLLLILRNIDYGKCVYNATCNTKHYLTEKDENGNLKFEMVSDFDVDYKSFLKVLLLHHIGKVMMFEDNTDEWQKNKRGILYKWVDNNTVLKAGERALYICQKCGIELTEEEFEAMKINDKTDEDKFSMLHISPLSMLVKMADDLTYMKINSILKKKS